MNDGRCRHLLKQATLLRTFDDKRRDLLIAPAIWLQDLNLGLLGRCAATGGGGHGVWWGIGALWRRAFSAAFAVSVALDDDRLVTLNQHARGVFAHA
jgi:hypothetical protein